MDRRQLTAAIVGALAGLVLSLALLGDDGPGIEARHLLFLVAAGVIGLVLDRSSRRRQR